MKFVSGEMDSKSELNLYCQKYGLKLPQYNTRHNGDNYFESDVTYGPDTFFGTGSTKKEAEKDTAKAVLEYLNDEEPKPTPPHPTPKEPTTGANRKYVVIAEPGVEVVVWHPHSGEPYPGRPFDKTLHATKEGLGVDMLHTASVIVEDVGYPTFRLQRKVPPKTDAHAHLVDSKHTGKRQRPAK